MTVECGIDAANARKLSDLSRTSY